MKRLASFVVALLFFVLATSTATSTARADVSETCKTPVLLTSFTQGLDYLNGSLVWVQGNLECRLDEMTVIFNISDISRLQIQFLSKKQYEQFAKNPAYDSFRKTLKAWLGVTHFQASLKFLGPVGNLKRVNGIVVRVEKDTKPYKPLPIPIQRMIKAYRAMDRETSVWIRITHASVDKRTSFVEGVGIILYPPTK